METTARSKVVIDNQQAEQALSELTQEAKRYKQAMTDAIKSNDLGAHKKAEQQWKATNKAIKDARVELHSIDKVMKNLSGASMKQLQFAKRSLTTELNKMTRGTDEYIKKSRQLKQVNGEIGKVRNEMNGLSGANQGLFGKMRSGFMWMAGAVGSAMVLWRGFTSTLKTTQSGGDALERTLQGVKGATTALQQTIAQGDWSNLISNMRKGYEAASNYATALDELADRSRAVDLRSDEQKSEMEELRNIMSSVETATIEERQQAQDRYMELNREILEATKKNADLLIKAERDKLMKQHGLTEGQVDRLVDYVREYDKLTEGELLNVKKVLDAQEALRKEEGKIARARTSARGDRMREMTKAEKDSLASLSLEVSATKGLLNEKELAYYQLNDVIDKFSDAQRDNVAKALKSVAAAKTQYENLQRNAVRRQQALEREKKQRDADTQKAELEALEQHHVQMLLEIDRAYLEEHQNKDTYSQQLELAEWAHLEARIALYKQFSMDTTELEKQRVAQQIQAMEQLKQSQFAISDEILAKNIADTDAALEAQFAAWEREDEVEKNRADKEKERDAQLLAAYIERMEQYKSVATSMASSLGNLLGRAATDAEMTAQEVVREMVLIALDGLHAIVQISLAQIWTKAIGNPIKMVTAIGQTAAIELLFAGVKAAVSNVGQRYDGKYDVIGEVDGRTYRNVPYDGQMKTGIYDKPTLVAERGPELIVDHGTLKNVQVNFPDVLPKIRASMVPQRAMGNVAERISTPSASVEIANILDNNNKALIDNTKLIATLSNQLNQGIAARIEFSKIEEANTKVSKIRRDVSRS